MKLAHRVITIISVIIISLTSIGMEQTAESDTAISPDSNSFVLDFTTLQSALLGHELFGNGLDQHLSNEEYADQSIRLTQRMLIDAIVSDESSTVQWCLEQGANPNMGALVIIRDGQVSLLPLSHLDVPPLASYSTTIDKTGYVLNVIHLAALNERSKILNLLLKHGAKADMQASNGLQAIHLAATGGYLNNVQLLIEYGSPINAQISDGTTPLHAALATGKTKVVEFLMSNGAHAEANDKDCQQPIHNAANDNVLAIFKLLTKQKADLKAQTNTCHTPVDFAQQDEQHVVVDLLEEHDVSEKKHEQLKQVKKLLNRRIGEPYKKKFGHMEFIHKAAILGDIKVADLLVAHGEDINKRIAFDDGLQVIHLAALYGHVEFIKWLKAMNVDLNAPATAITCLSEDTHFHQRTGMPQTDKGMQAIHFAASADKLEVLKLLVDSGVDVASKDESGNQAIHFAACGGHQAIVEWLVSKKVDIKAKNNKHKHSLDMALVCRHKELAKFLQKTMKAEKQAKKSVLSSLPSFRRAKNGIML